VSFAWAGGQVVGGSAFAALAGSTSDAAAYVTVAAAFGVTLGAVLARPRPREAAPALSD
jgi:hypothetical protein